MMKALNLKDPREFTEKKLELSKKLDQLSMNYQVYIGIQKFLRNHKLFNEETRNADAVVLFSSTVLSFAGKFSNYFFYLDF